MFRLDRQTRLLVVQPTPFCNINCSYCYLPNRANTKKLSLPLAKKIFANVLSFPTVANELTVVWHAGEPLVLSPAYYEELYGLIRELAGSRVKIKHAIQTNGTLISESWCKLIRNWGVEVGISIDGPAELHDRHRVFRNGSGSFERTFAGLKMLQACNIPFHVIMVITIDSIGRPNEIFNFLTANKIYDVRFSIEEQEGANTRSEVLSQSQSSGHYMAFLKTFLSLAIASGSQMRVREFDDVLARVERFGEPVKNSLVNPFEIISIDFAGNLSTFSPELLSMKHPRYNEFVFGNAAEDDFETISARIESSELYSDIKEEGVRSCRTKCEYFPLCGGGAPSNKIFENGTANSTETGYCRSMKTAIDVAVDILRAVEST